MATFFKRNCPGYLVDPHTGVDLVEVDGGVAPVDQPDQVYPVQNGIIHLIPHDDSYDRTCEAKGWQMPDAYSFRTLPRDPLDKWEPGYWKKRALSTATIWQVLEEDRRAKRILPLGEIGVAADITDALPYVAYGLDVGGYTTVSISAQAGAYGLDAYYLTRYCRIHAGPAKLPLRAGLFDVVIFSASLPLVSAAALSDVLHRGVAALKRGGRLIISDTPEQAEIIRILQGLGIHPATRVCEDREVGVMGKAKQLLSKRVSVPPLIIGQKS
jgi:hypothetical protein